jgi:hypothetical protein
MAIIEIACSECDGEGRIETIVAIAADGDRIIEGIRCQVCAGSGYIEWEAEEYAAAMVAQAEEVMSLRRIG